MKYRTMIEKSRSEGRSNESTMWKSIDRVDELLSHLKHSHPEYYWNFIRESHQDMNGCHYDELFAEYDVSNIHYTDTNGSEHHGAHYTLDECVERMRNFSLPTDTTNWDIYVALNATYADLCKGCNESEIPMMCYLLYFADEDAPEGKIWHYMNAMRH